ncbi:hypothetical protein QSV08_05880 [Maribacter sp. BPC-D8]|uniref:hypothetical protein n=1 Tax=Maribacter sp. BPC-D8 TaxID=3053613 RepID=UPI002B497C4A|nr:hypothetical protein [Maribacter sp. BPC-D8]WRI30771.1 hypothetical protein QSV08_05880 [Maribacter sp. BPC-D8]
MKQKEELDICINLINWIQDYSISNDEILSQIKANNYLNKSIELDKKRIDKQPLLTLPSLSLFKIIENIINTLNNVDESLAIHNQRYGCSYLNIKDRLFQSFENLELSTTQLIEYLEKAEYIILQYHLTEYVIKKQLLQNEVKKSLELISKISDKSYHYSSYRLIANFYGLKGDKNNFLKILKKCDARKDVYEIECIKENFIENYSCINSLEESFELIERREFGNKYYIAALLPIVKIKTFDEVKELLNDSRFEVPKLYIKEIILTKAFELNKKNQNTENFNYLKGVLNEIPSRVKYGNSDFSLRDNLWISIAESLLAKNNELFKQEINYSIKRINSKIPKRSLSNKVKT